VVVIAVSVFGWTRPREQQQAADDLAAWERAAGSALVRTDERVRFAADEHAYAVAQEGEAATADLADALGRARRQLAEAFHLNQLLHDHAPETDAQRWEWNQRIVALCDAALADLDEQTSALAARRDVAARAPEEIERVRADVERVRASIEPARQALAALSGRYTDAALLPVSANPDQAEQLLELALRSAGAAESRQSAERADEAQTLLRAAAESVRRAQALLAAVDGFEAEAIQAEATLAAMVAESRAELAHAQALPERARAGRIDAAIAALEAALAALPAAPTAGERIDPIGSLTSVRQANTALDDAVADHAEATERRERLRAQLITAMDDAERQIATARELVLDYRAPIGPDARTRLAEAERELVDITDEREPEAAIARARRAAALAAEAAALARAAIHGGPADWERWGSGYEHGGYGRRQGYGGPGGGGFLGGMLGGLVLGGIFDGLEDVGDIFD
jgi:hypothetical protein